MDEFAQRVQEWQPFYAPQGGDARNGRRRGALKVLAFVMLAVTGLGVLVQGDAAILGFMVLPMMFLLISASLDTWFLLLAVQEASANS